MSVDAYIVLENGGEPFDPNLVEGLPSEMEAEGDLYGKDVARNTRWLDDVCREIGCEPLSTFIVYDSDIERLEVSGEPPPWHDPAAGLSVVQALEAHFSRLPPNQWIPARGNRTTPDALLWDLKAYRIILSGAVESGQRFCIVLD